MYTTREDPPKEIQDALKAYDPLSQRLLFARGITDEAGAALFFDKSWKETDPYQYTTMYAAADRVLKAVCDSEVIGIYSDYDCDGIPAAAALYSTLRALGHEKITYFVPDRNTQGFGVNQEGITHMLNEHASVVCILDCGTANPSEVAHMQQNGIDVIILDHHLPKEELPPATALINPTVEKGIAEPHPCGAGVTFLFIQALITQAQETSITSKPPVGWERWQLDIVGLATLSDMVPLRDVNRQLAHYGLEVFRKSPRPGIKALCSLLKLRQDRVTQDDLTFLIVPRINAASRMGDAHLAFQLLTSDSVTHALRAATALTTLNDKRKATVAAAVKKANKTAQRKNQENDIWVFGDRSWKPSLTGLIAQKLVEAYGKTVFVWGQCSGSETVRGSCRSKHHDIFTLMQKTPAVFAEAGGHARAGGFTLNEGCEVLLEDALNTASSATPLRQEPKAYIDAHCRISDVADILTITDHFAPFGMHNDRITIALNRCHVQSMARFGKKKDHVRYTFVDGTNRLQGITFFAGDTTSHMKDTPCTVIGSVEQDVVKNQPCIRVENVVSNHA